MDHKNNSKLSPPEVLAKIKRDVTLLVNHYELTHPEQYDADIKKPLETHEEL